MSIKVSSSPDILIEVAGENAIQVTTLFGQNGQPGAPGINGQSPELRVDGGWIQWKLPFSAVWTDLVPLSDLEGPQGDQGDPGQNGQSVVLRASDTHIQWKLESDSTWTDLILLSELKGPQGDQGPPGTPAPLPLWRRLNASVAVDHTITTFQNIFPSPASVALKENTLYEFLLLVAGKYAGEPATVTAHAIQFQFLESVAGIILGGATLFDGRRSLSGALGANNGTWAWTDALLSPLSMTSGAVTTGQGFAYRACGSIRTGNAGSITPQFRFTPNAPGTAFELSDGTMMILRELGPSSSGGNW